VESIEDAGFEGRLLGQGCDSGGARLHIDNMICSACSGKIEKALLAQPGVLDASVSLITHKAEVQNVSRCFFKCFSTTSPDVSAPRRVVALYQNWSERRCGRSWACSTPLSASSTQAGDAQVCRTG